MKYYILIVLSSFLFLGCTKTSEKVTNQEDTNSTQNQENPSSKDATSKSDEPAENSGSKKEPDAITVQHILVGFHDAVGFNGNPPESAARRTKDEAERLVNEIRKMIDNKESYQSLVDKYSDDKPPAGSPGIPGVYSMTNTNAPSLPDHAPRGEMVAAFGDVGFKLEVGEIGVAEYAPNGGSPLGWHIIKRLK